jgi:hypothetical protein
MPAGPHLSRGAGEPGAADSEGRLFGLNHERGVGPGGAVRSQLDEELLDRFRGPTGRELAQEAPGLG